MSLNKPFHTEQYELLDDKIHPMLILYYYRTSGVFILTAQALFQDLYIASFTLSKQQWTFGDVRFLNLKTLSCSDKRRTYKKAGYFRNHFLFSEEKPLLAGECAHVGDGAGAEGFEVVAAFEDRDDASLGVLFSDSFDDMGKYGEVVVGEVEASEGIGDVSIKTC